MSSSRVPIVVENTSDLHRNNEPVNLGIPIPMEEKVANVDQLKLFNSAKKEIPCQFTVVARWPQTEYISWVFVHFQANVSGKDTSQYYLEIKASQDESIRKNSKIAYLKDNTLRLDTGKLKFSVGTDSVLAIVSKLLSASNDRFAGPRLLTEDGVRLIPGKPRQVHLDENGTEKAVLKLVGSYIAQDEMISMFDYAIRLEFYRNKSYFRLFNTVICKEEKGALADASFIVPTKEKRGSIYKQNGKPLAVKDATDEVVALIQDSHKEYYLHQNSESSRVENRFQGWITTDKVSATTRFFWQMYPKSLELDQGEFRLGLLPGLSTNKDSFKLTDQIVDCYSFAEGEARTHELMIYTHEQQPEPKELASVFAGLNAPLMPRVPWDWYVNSQFFGDLTVKDDLHYPKFENLVNDSLKMILQRRESLGLYGDRNFGDDLMNKSGMWNNCEYDYPHVGVLQFIRGSGQKWYNDFALPAARHMYNIDFANAGIDAGKVYPHSIGHNSARPKLGSHSWLQGILDYYLMSADYRARDLALLVGERWCTSILNAERIGGTERAVTWPLISMLALYKVFGDAKYMEAATKICNRVVELFNFELGHFEGGMKRDNYPPSYWQVFLMGSPVLESLIMYYQMTGEETIKDIIVAIAKRLAKVNWIEDIGQWEYTKTGGLRGHHTPKNNRMVSPGVGYAYLYSGDQNLWDKAVIAFENSYGEIDDQGKEMTQSLRFGVRMPALMAKVENI